MIGTGLLKRLRRDESGAAAVEFAAWSVVALTLLLVSVDFGFYLVQTGRIASASEQGAVVTYNRREAGAVDATAIATFVNAAAQAPGDPVRTAVTCNGTAQACNAAPSARQCVCVSGMTPTYTTAGSCGAPCPSGATSGYYVTLSSEYDFDPLISPHPFLENKVIRQSVTVRLQ